MLSWGCRTRQEKVTEEEVKEDEFHYEKTLMRTGAYQPTADLTSICQKIVVTCDDY